MSILRSAVVGVGGYLPEDVVTNADLALIVETSDLDIKSSEADFEALLNAMRRATHGTSHFVARSGG